MRKTINISVPEEMHAYVLRQVGCGTVSEYIRGLIRREQRQRADYMARPVRSLARASDCGVFVDALDQLEKLKAILERKDVYDD